MGEDSIGQGKFISEPPFKIYMGAFQVIALLLPLVLILAGPVDAAASAVPAVVTLLWQALGEQSTFTSHDVLQVLIPVGFNAYRMFPVMEWVRTSHDLFVGSSAPVTNHKNTFNVALACVNLVFWTYNLFVFLLLRVLPVYFDRIETPTVEMAYTLVPLPKRTAPKED